MVYLIPISWDVVVGEEGRMLKREVVEDRNPLDSHCVETGNSRDHAIGNVADRLVWIAKGVRGLVGLETADKECLRRCDESKYQPKSQTGGEIELERLNEVVGADVDHGGGRSDVDIERGVKVRSGKSLFDLGDLGDHIEALDSRELEVAAGCKDVLKQMLDTEKG